MQKILRKRIFRDLKENVFRYLALGFMIILGKDERAKFEADRENYAKEIQARYDEAKTYHDGKWIMFEPVDTSLFPDFLKLLNIKRRPNRK